MPAASTSAAFDPAATRRALQRWYRANGRHSLPWRLTRDPYAVLVSEVMLQQTQVNRVLPHYQAWLERWPTFEALAAAPTAEVIRQWRGLGYNRRALNLHRLAIAVTEQHGSVLPLGSTLRSLPGIGAYTEAAVRCFAFGETVPVADTNIARVLARLLCGAPSDTDLAPREVTNAALALLPARDGRAHNLALMDLGALVCTARSPRCEDCPVRRMCAWRAHGRPDSSNRRPPAARFESTSRFARGRIVDYLREAPATEVELEAALTVEHRPRLSLYLATLAADGMVARNSDGSWSLPGSPG
jgi:A/G-specific adenine glycosylase